MSAYRHCSGHFPSEAWLAISLFVFFFHLFQKITHAHTQPFYGPFPGITRVSRCQKKSSGLYSARDDIRGRHTDNPAGCHSIRANQLPTSLIPQFYAGYLSCCNPPNLSWLGTGTKYAGLHTQWLGLFQYPVAWFVPKENLCDNWHRYFAGPMSFLSSQPKVSKWQEKQSTDPSRWPNLILSLSTTGLPMIEALLPLCRLSNASTCST